MGITHGCPGSATLRSAPCTAARTTLVERVIVLFRARCWCGVPHRAAPVHGRSQKVRYRTYSLEPLLVMIDSVFLRFNQSLSYQFRRSKDASGGNSTVVSRSVININTREPEMRPAGIEFKYTAVGPESNSRLQFGRFNISDESLVVGPERNDRLTRIH